MGRYRVTYSGRFKKDLKRYQKRQRELDALTEVLEMLSLGGAAGLPRRMRPHRLAGGYSGFWECHIFPDFLLVWEQAEQPFRYIYLARLGSHSDLF